MRPGIYKHVYCRDVAMKVLKSLWVPNRNAFKVRNQWINVATPEHPFLIDTKPETNWITYDQVKNWKPYDADV